MISLNYLPSLIQGNKNLLMVNRARLDTVQVIENKISVSMGGITVDMTLETHEEAVKAFQQLTGLNLQPEEKPVGET